MRLKVTILAALAAFSLAAADNPPKPEPKAEVAPIIATGKLWRLIVKAQATRQQLAETPLGKAAAKADEAVQEEQQRLASACGANFTLGYGPDEDLVCVPKPAQPDTTAKK